MTDRPVTLTTSGPPETLVPWLVLHPGDADRLAAVATIVAANPRFLDGWARLGQLGRDDIEQYSAFRVGYHRGLDRLRANGWRGSGYVRWLHEENRGFLRALHGLSVTAGRIGEHDEEERCALFLRQLDPAWPPVDLD